jgi:hypothetical protein
MHALMNLGLLQSLPVQVARLRSLIITFTLRLSKKGVPQLLAGNVKAINLKNNGH